ncbi:UDP-2,4-diacetamido-2,4,6-trideoxy-beta-L-altropyranose hydrolase [Vreelandella subterranea]|uniref:UDP-2,4-diacetamido-2,4,6-trideoxy-beta-L-altropyranose hydrolase n=1 Tax=Vreelandella subterranea TaxID=416874 RepID=A0A1H9WLE2_9GAMM|nr:UDP-2,4-diacetamido-2,4,6-trideoxy-beta-L-altropyranose hydrolase [Halomonas subterranea]SES34708.1 UDP-2,4-diacetamido-2,4,6-trideoxy-beta-L-altropyranose hydrolase [Halomonas subterranea]
MKFIIRVDASVQIGTGHVMRCLALAEELRRQGHQCLFICRNHKGNIAELIVQKGFELHLLHSPKQTEKFVKDEQAVVHSGWLGVPWQTDAQQTLEVLVNHNPDWLIVDHYALDAKWERQLVEAVGQILVIDDLADREHMSTVLLDQNFGRQSTDYDELVPPTCTKLIGPKYALLRTEFAEMRAASLERRRTLELKRILISLGGVDRTNVTGQILGALSSSTLPPEIELDIVMGRSAPHLETVKKQALELPFQATVSVSVSNMAERMCLADLAIGAAGSTAWEMCCLGLPAILLVLADNQRMVNQSLIKAGIAKGLDIQALKTEDSIKIDNVVKDAWCAAPTMTEKGASVADGFGCARLANFLVGV